MTQETTTHGSQDPFKKRGFKSIKQSVTTSLTEVRTGMFGKRRVYPTKWDRLNRNFLGGLQPGKMYVVAGRPGVGKSAFSNQLIFDVLDSNQDKEILVLYWSFEMPGYQQILRAGAKGSKKEVSELLSVEQKLTDAEYEKYRNEVIKYNDYPMYFNNIPRDMEFIKDSNVEITNRNPDATIINVFDHSRLILSGKDQELQKLNEVSKGCMWLQAKIGCINILLSQLNRNIEQEHRAKAQYQPLLTDLFGGDSIGQDAHVVMMLQRPNDLYGITDKYCGHDPIGLLAIHVEKNRDGLLGMIPFEAEMSTFTINERKK
jgi:replicative DNA helicase|tara:strand:- start:197 stop:1144 length:948 start_codon:yes stop_codon:yes gene_type:complete